MGTKIERKDQFTFIVDGNELPLAEFVKQYCPSEEFVKWYSNSGIAGSVLIGEYIDDYMDYNIYGWKHFFILYKFKSDYKVMEEWDSKYHVLLY